MQRDSPSATKNSYLLFLNRRYFIHCQYSVSGFGILELTKSREWVLSTLAGQKRPFLLLFRAYWKRSCVRICRFGGHEKLMMSTHSARWSVSIQSRKNLIPYWLAISILIKELSHERIATSFAKFLQWQLCKDRFSMQPLFASNFICNAEIFPLKLFQP